MIQLPQVYSGQTMKRWIYPKKRNSESKIKVILDSGHSLVKGIGVFTGGGTWVRANKSNIITYILFLLFCQSLQKTKVHLKSLRGWLVCVCVGEVGGWREGVGIEWLESKLLKEAEMCVFWGLFEGLCVCVFCLFLSNQFEYWCGQHICTKSQLRTVPYTDRHWHTLGNTDR